MNRPKNLFYICHSDNLASILRDGIYCKRDAPLNFVISDQTVMERRAEKVVTNGKKLPEYVNLYFCVRNAMLYRLVCNYNRDNLVILSVSPSVFDLDGVYVSDRNAAVANACFFPAEEGLRNLDEKVFSNKYWTDSDDVRQRMMAEVLVPEHIPPRYIISVYTHRERQRIDNMDFVPEPDMFFLPTYRNQLNDLISLSKGDMFFSDMQVFTISVNTKGVMGKGLASRTKYQFPDAYVRYQDDWRNGKLKIGQPTLYKRAKRIEEELADEVSALRQNKLNGFRWFLFLPTKDDWRHDSKMEYIEQSLQWLVDHYEEEEIKSIALPALGCGLGNLRWQDVGPVMCKYLRQMTIPSCIYLPIEQDIPSEFLSKEYLLH